MSCLSKQQEDLEISRNQPKTHTCFARRIDSLTAMVQPTSSGAWARPIWLGQNDLFDFWRILAAKEVVIFWGLGSSSTSMAVWEVKQFPNEPALFGNVS